MGLRNREISCGCVIDLQLLHEQLLSEGIAGRRQNRNEGKVGKKVGMTERISVASQSYRSRVQVNLCYRRVSTGRITVYGSIEHFEW
ncbi:hypothetical protein SLA2020_300490 [Shorea laevis]